MILNGRNDSMHMTMLIEISRNKGMNISHTNISFY